MRIFVNTVGWLGFFSFLRAGIAIPGIAAPRGRD